MRISSVLSSIIMTIITLTSARRMLLNMTYVRVQMDEYNDDDDGGGVGSVRNTNCIN